MPLPMEAPWGIDPPKPLCHTLWGLTDMANGDLIIKGDAGAALRAVVEAVAAAGGTVSSQIPGQPVRFSLIRACDFWRDGYKSMTYDGTARFMPAGPDHTRIAIELNPASKYIIGWVIAFLVIFFAGGTLLGVLGALGPIVGIGLLVWIGWQAFQGMGPSARDMMDTLLTRLAPLAAAP